MVYTCPEVGLVEQRTRTTMHSLRLSAEGAAMTGGHGGSGIGAFWLPPPFSAAFLGFTLCVKVTAAESLPQAVRSPHYTRELAIVN